MLIPVQSSGPNPPLYFIHGLQGIMPMGRFLVSLLGPSQPLYAINANGMDGRDRTPTTVKEMAVTYVDEICKAQPSGPLLIAGMCAGGLAAMEVARELQVRGREPGPVILVDPPLPGHHIRPVDTRNPLIAAQLYERVRGKLLEHASHPHNDMPFVLNDQDQIHAATSAAVTTLVAFCTHVPEVFLGAAVAILSSRRAHAFFHPQMYWIKLLPRLVMTHVLPFEHTEMFRSGRHELARILKFVLESDIKTKIPAKTEIAAEPDVETALALL
jgi:thioesterase domain-containing protein